MGSIGSKHNAERGYLDGVVQESAWATPAARDYKDSGDNTNYQRGADRCILPGQVVVAEGGPTGALNPDWVDALMGYQVGYTLPTGEPIRSLPNVWPAGLGAEQHDWEPPRLTTVKENRAARLKALGNSIVPQVARLWLEAIQEEENL